jgi:hypothetical protein
MLLKSNVVVRHMLVEKLSNEQDGDVLREDRRLSGR